MADETKSVEMAAKTPMTLEDEAEREKMMARLEVAEKRRRWRDAQGREKRIGWIKPIEGYQPLCGGNSGHDWSTIVFLYIIFYGCLLAVFSGLLVGARESDVDYEIHYVFFVFMWLGFAAVGYLIHSGRHFRMEKIREERSQGSLTPRTPTAGALTPAV